MKKISICLAFIFVFFVLPVNAITWGDPDVDHPNVGAMVLLYPDGNWYPICSGTLIHPQIFLTAGHCTQPFENPADIYSIGVTFDNEVQGLTDPLSVTEVITHPDYYWGPQSNPYDVGVLILHDGITNIDPAYLPDEGLLDSLFADKQLNSGKNKAKFTIVGYGGTLSWPPPDITYYDSRQYAVSEFRALLKAWLRLSQNQATEDGGSCYGDSGGPAFWTDENEDEILVGITSWGDTPCVATGFYYRVDIPETLNFIDNAIESLNSSD